MYLYSAKLSTLWRVLGLAPIPFRNRNVISKFFVAYSIVVMGMITLFASYPIAMELNGSIRIRMATTTARIGCTLDHLSSLMCCMTGIVFNIVYFKDMIILMNLVQNIDKMIDIRFSDDKFLKIFYAYAICFAITILTDIINWYIIDPNTIIYAPSYFLHVVVFGIQFGYIDIVLQIKRRFVSLNMILAEKLMVDTFDNSLLTRKCIRVMGNYLTESRVSSFTHVHWMLCDVVRQINRCFGYQILLVMLSILVHIIITPYFFILGIAYPQHLDRKNWIYFVTQSLWTVLHASQLVIITWSCSTTTEKANETAPLMSKCLMKNFGSDTQKELEGCVIQLVHHKASFSACGLFDINLHILTAVTGAVTTYLVILIQFQNADKDSN